MLSRWRSFACGEGLALPDAFDQSQSRRILRAVSAELLEGEKAGRASPVCLDRSAAPELDSMMHGDVAVPFRRRIVLILMSRLIPI